jgi:hypothetical protein
MRARHKHVASRCYSFDMRYLDWQTLKLCAAISTVCLLIYISRKPLLRILKISYAPKVSGTVIGLREYMSPDGLMYAPDVSYLDASGAHRVAQVSTAASWKFWKIGDSVVLAIEDDGNADLYWPIVIFGLPIMMLSILIGFLYLALFAK